MQTVQLRRVVITGLGMVTPLGTGVEPTWENIKKGVSGAARVTDFDVSDLPCQIAAQIKRGAYLVNAVAGCGDCHTPMGPNGPIGPLFSGAKLPFAPTQPMPWAERSAAIAGLPTGYTRAQMVALLRTGTKPNGSAPRPRMPQYRMNRDDAEAVTAYIASLRK